CRKPAEPVALRKKPRLGGAFSDSAGDAIRCGCDALVPCAARAARHLREIPGRRAAFADPASRYIDFGKPGPTFAGAGRAPRQSARRTPCSEARSSTG